MKNILFTVLICIMITMICIVGYLNIMNKPKGNCITISNVESEMVKPLSVYNQDLFIDHENTAILLPIMQNSLSILDSLTAITGRVQGLAFHSYINESYISINSLYYKKIYKNTELDIEELKECEEIYNTLQLIYTEYIKRISDDSFTTFYDIYINSVP